MRRESVSSAPLNDVNEASRQRIPITAAPIELSAPPSPSWGVSQPAFPSPPAPAGAGTRVENPSAASA